MDGTKNTVYFPLHLLTFQMPKMPPFRGHRPSQTLQGLLTLKGRNASACRGTKGWTQSRLGPCEPFGYL